MQILIRINLFTLILAYTMNTDYISYYFSPLVSWWYIIIYATMLVGAKYNDRTVFLVIKIFLSMTLVALFMKTEWLLGFFFGFLERLAGIHWSAKEWSFRVNLDIFIVYAGMLAAILVIKSRELHWTEHPMWPLVTKVAAGASALVFAWFFVFELTMDKFAYNTWHPLISFLPVVAFVILRNANAVLRSASSKAFVFIGKCSLETFIIQYHLWLAGDTKGILIIIPGARWRSVNMAVTTIIFIYVSHNVALATGELTKWLCDEQPPATLPPPVNAPTREQNADGDDEGQVIFEASDTMELPVRKDTEGNILPPEPDTPARAPRRWVDRLAEGNGSPRPAPGFRIWYGEKPWYAGLKARLLMILGVMWIVNILWWYPPTIQ